MTQKPLLDEAYRQEIARAQSARASGNEGMARVCARRAAGLIAGAYLHRIGYPHSNPSAYQLLKQLMSLTNLDPKIKQIAGHFLLPVNHNRQLPVQVDLVDEAQWLARTLLNLV